MIGTNRKARRAFFKKFAGMSAAFGAMLSGVMPELAKAVSPSSAPPTLDPVPVPPLPADQQNALYAASLNNPDVAAIASALGQPLRIDPPVASNNSTFDGGHRMVSVVLPLTSYATGLAVAYLYFGTATVVEPDGTGNTLPIRLAVCNDGQLRVGLSGAAQVAPPSSTPTMADALFAMYFPDEYIAAVERANPLQAARFGLGGTWAKLLGSYKRTMMADGDGALEDCRNAYRICLRGPTYACTAAGVGAVVCVVVLIAGCAPTPLWGATCYGAAMFCAAVVTAATACGLSMNYCRQDFLRCRRNIGAGGGART